jgi:uncharacterized protein (DUF885 family)
VVPAQLVVNNVIGQLDTHARTGRRGLDLLSSRPELPDDRSRSRAGAPAHRLPPAITGQIRPAFTRLRDFLSNEYLPRRARASASARCRAAPGSTAPHRGVDDAPLTADYVHELGLREVARIRGEMDAIRREVGFTGDLAAFLRAHPHRRALQAASAAALNQGYEEIGRRVDQRIATSSAPSPETRLDIRPVPAFLERNQAGAYYQGGTPDGSRPGVFYFNTYDLPSRTTPGMETLYLHEAVPGHHFQISLAQENEHAPQFHAPSGQHRLRRRLGALCREIGARSSACSPIPISASAISTTRCFAPCGWVVETGIHAMGWSRDRAIQYMLSNSAMGRTDATSEVERYIAIPGQALAYKIGQLKILELRQRARDALGARFDIREFHEQVLATGALPLTVLERKIDDWIASRRATG